MVKALAKRLFVFHPEDKGSSSWQNREQLVRAIAALPVIADPSAALTTALSEDDAAALRGLVDELGRRVAQALATGDLGTAAQALHTIGRFQLVGHGCVEAMLRAAEARVEDHVVELELVAQSAAVLGRLPEALAAAGQIDALAKALLVCTSSIIISSSLFFNLFVPSTKLEVHNIAVPFLLFFSRPYYLSQVQCFNLIDCWCTSALNGRGHPQSSSH